MLSVFGTPNTVPVVTFNHTFIDDEGKVKVHNVKVNPVSGLTEIEELPVEHSDIDRLENRHRSQYNLDLKAIKEARQKVVDAIPQFDSKLSD